jgi:hypothetical protein
MHFSLKRIKRNALSNLIDFNFVSWIQNACKLCLTMIINCIDWIIQYMKNLNTINSFQNGYRDFIYFLVHFVDFSLGLKFVAPSASHMCKK